MQTPKPMLTISQILNRLSKDKGIYREFFMDENNAMKLKESDVIYQPEDLRVVKAYRYEGLSNPDDNSVLYVLEDKNGNRGIILDSYGAETNYSKEFYDFLRAIPIHEKEEYNFDEWY